MPIDTTNLDAQIAAAQERLTLLQTQKTSLGNFFVQTDLDTALITDLVNELQGITPPSVFILKSNGDFQLVPEAALISFEPDGHVGGA